MDKLDISIIRELSQSQLMLPAKIGLKSSYRDLAKKLEVSSGTIWNRIRLMNSSGFLLGSSVYLNPSLLGLKGGAYAFDIDPSVHKTSIIEKLEQIEGLLFIHNFRGTFVGFAFTYESERDLQNKIQEFRDLGATGSIFSRIAYPPCEDSFTEFEWALVSRLTQGTFQSYAQLAKELKTSVRSLNRGIARITRARAVLSSPTLNYRAIVGGVPADLVVVFASREARAVQEAKILSLVLDFLLFLGAGEDYNVYNLIVPGIQKASDLADTVAGIDGVKIARAELVEEHIDLTKNLRKLKWKNKISNLLTHRKIQVLSSPSYGSAS